MKSVLSVITALATTTSGVMASEALLPGAPPSSATTLRSVPTTAMTSKEWEFEPNRGQEDPTIAFRVNRPGFAAYLRRGGIAFVYPGRANAIANHEGTPAPEI